MKTIKIFLASSEELDYDRMAFGNLVRRLDDMYEKRGIRIKLFEWEDYDSAYNDRRKQDEYNDYVRQSDIFLALFHKKAGQFTVEEFDIASQEFKDHASPKVYTYCKDLKPGDEETPELKEFKKRLFDEMGHYWCRYDNRESLHLQFVMQLQLVESSQIADMKVENGNVTINGLPIAAMDKLKFASCNEEYIKMSEELASLPEEIEMYRMMVDAHPDQPKYKDQLQKKLDKHNQLKKDLEEYQQILFNTAKRIAQLQGKRITERMQRAMAAFNEGKVREANIILDEAEADARKNFEDYKQSKEITELKRQAVFNSIEELLLKTSTIMADAGIPIEERIKNTQKIYAQADEMAQETDYNNEKYIELLHDYCRFLSVYAKYDTILVICKRLINKCEEFYGKGHLYTASIYNDISTIYYDLSKYDTAMEFCKKSLAICKKELGDEHPDTVSTYINIGNIYDDLCDYTKALDFYQKSLTILEKTYGKNHPDIADLYNNIGNVECDLGEYERAIEHHQKALTIRKKEMGEEHYEIATSYDNLGNSYCNNGENEKALEYYQKALNIRKIALGEEHPNTAGSYINLGNVYCNLGEYENALESYEKSLSIRKIVYGEEHSYTADSYNNVGTVYDDLGEHEKALEYYQKALAIRKIVLGENHPYTADSYNNIGALYNDIDENKKALEYHLKALLIRKQALGEEHPDLAVSYNNLGNTYKNLGDYITALNYYKQSLAISKKIFGEEHLYLAPAYYNMGTIYKNQGDYNKALKYFQKAMTIREDFYGDEHPDTIISYKSMAMIYCLMGKYKEALPWAEKAFAAFPNVGLVIDTLATVYQGLGRYNEALELFEQCLKINKEENEPAQKIHDTEKKIEKLKEVLNS